MDLWLEVKHLRDSDSSILETNAFVLSVDFWLYAFDWERLRRPGSVGCVVLPNQLLQLLRRFIPTNDEFDRRFVETFAIPEIRSIRTDYKRAASKVLSYLNTYEDVPEETGARLLTNQMLLSDLETIDESSDAFRERIDSALATENAALEAERDQLLQEQAETSGELTEAQRRITTLTDALERTDASRESLRKRLKEAARKEEARKRAQPKSKPSSSERKTTLPSVSPQSEADQVNLVWWVVGLLTALVAILLSAVIPWGWLEHHPKKLGLHMGVALALVFFFGAVGSPKHRQMLISTGLVGVAITLITLLDP